MDNNSDNALSKVLFQKRLNPFFNKSSNQRKQIVRARRLVKPNGLEEQEFSEKESKNGLRQFVGSRLDNHNNHQKNGLSSESE